MKRRHLLFGCSVALLTALTACEKDINFDLNNAGEVMVVDGTIENGEAPIIILTRSLDFFSTVNPQQLLNSFVRDAEVDISNGTVTHRLREYRIPFGGGQIIFYTNDTANLSTAFVGQFNTRYQLTVRSEGKTYQATTTIPALTKRVDSLWWKPAPFQTDTTKVVTMITVTDPPGLGNYIRYFTKRNSEPFLPGENSVFDDQVIDNTTYTVQVDPGIDRNNPVPFDSSYFRRGDTISIKLSNIDRNTYRFWSTWEFAYQSIGNPFAQPNKVIGNISNGALGAFCGYASDVRTIIIPR